MKALRCARGLGAHRRSGWMSTVPAVSAERPDNLQERLLEICKRRGFVFPGSDIYGGLANSFDYGPLGGGAYIIYNECTRLTYLLIQRN